MTRISTAWLLAAAAAPAAFGQDRDVPDLEFLEYLGSWQESDADWVVVAGDFAGIRLPAGDEAPVAEAVGETETVTETEAGDESDDD